MRGFRDRRSAVRPVLGEGIGPDGDDVDRDVADLQRGAGIHKRAEEHVAGQPGGGVDPQHPTTIVHGRSR